MNKKILIAGIVGIVLLLGIVFMVFLFSKKPANTPPSANSPIFPSITPLSNVNTTPFQSPDISFTTPANTTTQEAPIQGGGRSVIIKLSEITPGDIIEIQMTPATLTPIQRIYDIMTGFGLTRSEITVGSAQIPAARFMGSMNLGGTLQQDVVVFEKNGLVYKIQMMYRGAAVNPTYEAQLQQVLADLSTP